MQDYTTIFKDFSIKIKDEKKMFIGLERSSPAIKKIGFVSKSFENLTLHTFESSYNRITFLGSQCILISFWWILCTIWWLFNS